MYIVGVVVAEQATAGQTVPYESAASKKKLTSATSALGYLLIGMGLLSWMAMLGSVIVSSEER